MLPHDIPIAGARQRDGGLDVHHGVAKVTPTRHGLGEEFDLGDRSGGGLATRRP
jgi:hypothetical protein